MSREVEKHWSVIGDCENNLSVVARCNDTLNMNLYGARGTALLFNLSADMTDFVFFPSLFVQPSKPHESDFRFFRKSILGSNSHPHLKST